MCSGTGLRSPGHGIGNFRHYLLDSLVLLIRRGRLVHEPNQADNNLWPTKLRMGGVMAAASNQVVAGADLAADFARGAFNGSWTLVRVNQASD